MIHPDPDSLSLTHREHQVLAHLAEGATYQTIARRLELSPHTVDTYLRRIRRKTGVTNRTELALVAFSLGYHPAFPTAA
jgi:DNA-binding CsgD family transcriptional regulator